MDYLSTKRNIFFVLLFVLIFQSYGYITTFSLFGRDANNNKKSVYLLIDGGRLAQIWDDPYNWNIDYPAELSGNNIRFKGTISIFKRDINNNKKNLFILTSDSRLAQVWDDNQWHLDFPAELAGFSDLRFKGGITLFERDAANNKKTIFVLTTDGRLAQIWDDNQWHLDFPAELAGFSNLRFKGGITLFERDAANNKKTLFILTTDSRLAQIWDDNQWHLDFPKELAEDKK